MRLKMMMIISRKRHEQQCGNMQSEDRSDSNDSYEVEKIGEINTLINGYVIVLTEHFVLVS